MLSAKIKIKAGGQHAQQILDQLPSLGVKSPKVELKPYSKGKANAGKSNGKASTKSF
jgi:hypothetical protein